MQPPHKALLTSGPSCKLQGSLTVHDSDKLIANLEFPTRPLDLVVPRVTQITQENAIRKRMVSLQQVGVGASADTLGAL